jgi:hypothetical protein
VFDAHLAPVCAKVRISLDELAERLAEHGYGGMLFGMMFEDFLSQYLPPDNKNIIDDYLERRGWRESVTGRRYLRQLRESVLSIYEVIAVSPSQHCDLTDLVRGGKTVRVYERMGTENLYKWDRIAARVLSTDGRHTFSGGILPYPPEASKSLLRVLAKTREQFDVALSRIDEKGTISKIESSDDLQKSFLRDAGPAFTSIWLLHTLEKLDAPMPEITNRDGETLEFANTRFPFLDENLEEIAARLDSAPDWERDGQGSQTWIWLEEHSPGGAKPKGGLAMGTGDQNQRPISGTLELTSGVLMLSTNSLKRGQRGTDALQVLLQNLIGPPLSELQTPEQLMADDTRRQGQRKRESTDAIDPQIAAEMIQQTLDQHYRQCLDEPIPALDTKTPRQCARSKTSRKKVVDWLKHLENNELRRASDQGQEPYDSSWMWDELKLTSAKDGSQ